MRNKTAEKYVHLILTILFLISIAVLAAVWSSKQTYDFTRSIFSYESGWWAFFMMLAIQYGPNVFLALFATSETEGAKWGWLGAWGILSLVDAGTNVGDFLSGRPGLWETEPLQFAVGVAICIIVIFAEEMLARSVAVAVADFSYIKQQKGERVPGWISSGGEAAMMASGRNPRKKNGVSKSKTKVSSQFSPPKRDPNYRRKGR